MIPVLRPYQEQALETLRSKVRGGSRRLLLVGPTGMGKMVLIAAMIHSLRRNYNGRALFIAHRKELIDQIVVQLASYGILEVGVIRSNDERTNRTMPVQVSTVQSLARRDAPQADIVFIDEAHRAAAVQYVTVAAKYPTDLIVGWTATPVRMDGKPLGGCFDTLIEAATYSQLIADGFIVAPIVYAARAPVDLSEIPTVAGDYVIDALEQAMNTNQVVGDLVREWQTHADRRRTVVFACTVKHSLSICERFRSAGIAAEHLDGNTSEDVREATLARLDRGETRVVTNCQILGEGWDMPSVKCIAIARPTKSLSLFMQMAGRAGRPWNNVTSIILDLGSNVDRHGLPHEDRIWSLTEKSKRKVEKNPYRVCPACFAYVLENPCELCQHFEPTKPREIREDTSQSLVERRPEDERRVFFVSKVAEAQTKGFQPGWVGVKFKEKFGAWPPWSWSNEAKAKFASDEGWRMRQVNRERERDFWKQRQGLEVEVPDEQKVKRVVQKKVESEELFGGWFKKQ